MYNVIIYLIMWLFSRHSQWPGLAQSDVYVTLVVLVAGRGSGVNLVLHF